MARNTKLFDEHTARILTREHRVRGTAKPQKSRVVMTVKTGAETTDKAGRAPTSVEITAKIHRSGRSAREECDVPDDQS